MKNRVYLKLVRNGKAVLFLILFLCACVGCDLIELGYYTKHILNGFLGLILLFGVALLCFPKNENLEGDGEVRDIPDLKEYKLIAGIKSTDSRRFASEQEAWNMLSKQLPGMSRGHAILYVYEKEKCPFIDKHTGINPLQEKGGDVSIINYWKPVCEGVL